MLFQSAESCLFQVQATQVHGWLNAAFLQACFKHPCHLITNCTRPWCFAMQNLFVFKMCEQYQCMVGSMELCGLQSTPWAVGEPLSKAGWHGLLGAVRGAGIAIKAQV